MGYGHRTRSNLPGDRVDRELHPSLRAPQRRPDDCERADPALGTEAWTPAVHSEQKWRLIDICWGAVSAPRASLRPRPGITDWTEGDSGLGAGAVVSRDDRPR